MKLICHQHSWDEHGIDDSFRSYSSFDVFWKGAWLELLEYSWMSTEIPNKSKFMIFYAIGAEWNQVQVIFTLVSYKKLKHSVSTSKYIPYIRQKFHNTQNPSKNA
jgi:hypothetical protein